MSARPREFMASGVMNGAADSTAGRKLGIGRVNDGVNVECSDIDELRTEIHDPGDCGLTKCA
jgi:hypothetical protein